MFIRKASVSQLIQARIGEALDSDSFEAAKAFWSLLKDIETLPAESPQSSTSVIAQPEDLPDDARVFNRAVDFMQEADITTEDLLQALIEFIGMNPEGALIARKPLSLYFAEAFPSTFNTFIGKTLVSASYSLASMLARQVQTGMVEVPGYLCSKEEGGMRFTKKPTDPISPPYQLNGLVSVR